MEDAIVTIVEGELFVDERDVGVDDLVVEPTPKGKGLHIFIGDFEIFLCGKMLCFLILIF